jgi:hypothetical protein
MARMTVAEVRKQHGCWLEGSRGWTASGLLVRMAANWGMPLDADDRDIITAYLNGHETVALRTDEFVDVTSAVVDQGGLADQAEEYLNTEVAPEGWTFGWRDGEFFLLPDHEWHDEEAIEDCLECGCAR